MPELNRRDFLAVLGAGAAMLAASPQSANSASPSTPIKPISGSWFEFQHPSTVEGVDWNSTCARFTGQQWDAKIKEIAQVGMEYLVLMGTGLYYRSFVPTRISSGWPLACADPLEAVLSAADKYGVKFFIGAGFYGDWESPNTIRDPVAAKKRLQAIAEITRLYSHHRSFYGWYWPDEIEIIPRCTKQYIQYVNTSSRLARQLTPKARILIAPYGTRFAVPDDEYVRQLAALDVDIIAYQDEVGVRKSRVEETPAYYEGLKKAHDRAQRAAIWADVEIFEFEGALKKSLPPPTFLDRVIRQSETLSPSLAKIMEGFELGAGVYASALLPASFERVLRQLGAVSPWVEKILVYQYQGMMNEPGSAAFCGSPESTNLYTAYVNWLHAQRQGTMKES